MSWGSAETVGTGTGGMLMEVGREARSTVRLGGEATCERMVEAGEDDIRVKEGAVVGGAFEVEAIGA